MAKYSYISGSIFTDPRKLPKTWRTPDGKRISNFDELPDSRLDDFGWYRSVRIESGSREGWEVYAYVSRSLNLTTDPYTAEFLFGPVDRPLKDLKRIRGEEVNDEYTSTYDSISGDKHINFLHTRAIALLSQRKTAENNSFLNSFYSSSLELLALNNWYMDIKQEILDASSSEQAYNIETAYEVI